VQRFDLSMLRMRDASVSRADGVHSLSYRGKLGVLVTGILPAHFDMTE
jgi:hypothetical protein